MNHASHDGGDEDKLGHLQVMALGVGTKFLSENLIRRESKINDGQEDMNMGRSISLCYGQRVRDSHAEVLARRAFRRLLTLEMLSLINDSSNHKKSSQIKTGTTKAYHRILKLVDDGKHDLKETNSNKLFTLIDGVTIHMYASSAPCGNATLKKFSKMSKERYRESLGPDQWPRDIHEPVPAHSLRLGQFALLVKRDNTASSKVESIKHMEGKGKVKKSEEKAMHKTSCSSKKRKKWPASESDEWCPPGTSTVYLNRGSLHSCSDKLCRWNCVGLQGSFLASLLNKPLYMTSLTVGRKFTSCICRRAVCCRAIGCFENKAGKMNAGSMGDIITHYKLNHPALLSTSVYLDEEGVLDMSGSKIIGQNIRFLSSLCWIWCPLENEYGRQASQMAECIDGDTGLVHHFCMDNSTIQNIEEVKVTTGTSVNYSKVCTFSLTKLFLQLKDQMKWDNNASKHSLYSLKQLRASKRYFSPSYEMAKDVLLQEDKSFCYWKRRENIMFS